MTLGITFNNKINLKKKYDTFIRIDINKLPSIEIEKYNNLWKKEIQSILNKNYNEKKIIDFFQFNKNSNHWFYIKFIAYYRYRETFIEIKILEKYIEDYDFIDVYSNNLSTRILNSVNSVHLVKSDKKGKKITPFFKTFFNFSVIFLFRFFISKKIFFKEKERVDFLHGRNASIKKIYINPKDTKEVNIMWGLLKEKYNSQFQTIEELDLTKELSLKKVNLKKKYFTTFYKNQYYSEYIYFRALFKFNIVKIIFKEIKKINELEFVLKKIAKTPTEKLFKSIITDKRGVFYLNIFKHNAYRSFFNNFKHGSSVLVYTENDGSGGLVKDAAKANNLTTYAIQHGDITKSNYSYSFSFLESKFNSYPDQSFVWGIYYKNLLINNSYYNENNIYTTGQLRSDVISSLKKNTTNSYIITFFSQPQPYLKDRYDETEILISTMSKLPHLTLIVKLHPREKNDIFEELINKYNVKNVIIDSTSDIYKLINKSDLNITCYSTVGVEVLYFNKILITLDVKNKDLANFTKKDISYTATNSDELISFINLYYKNNLLQKENVKQFLAKKSKLDGKCTERMYKKIKNIN